GATVPADVKGLKDPSRKFIDIDRDNFGDVMAKLAPKVTVNSQDLGGDLDLTFKSMDDFGPAALVQTVDILQKLQEQRSALRDILTKLDSNDALYTALSERIKNDQLGSLGQAANAQILQLEAQKNGAAGGGAGEKAPDQGAKEQGN